MADQTFQYTPEEAELLIESFEDDLREAKRKEEIAVRALQKIARSQPEIPSPENRSFGMAFRKAFDKQRYTAHVTLAKLGEPERNHAH